MIPDFEIQHRLRRAREVIEMDQIPFAEKLGVSRTTITNYENGHTKPRRIVVNAWALATGVPVEWLLTGAVPVVDRGPDELALAAGDVQRARRDSNPQPSGWESERSRAGSTSNVIPIGRKASQPTAARRPQAVGA